MIKSEQVYSKAGKDTNMMRFTPTMNFNGQCRNAMEMYREAFCGKVTGLLTQA